MSKPRNMSNRRAQEILKALGYPINVDGQWGKWSKRALRDCIRMFAWSRRATGFEIPRVGGRLTARRAQVLHFINTHDGRCSRHFRYWEFRCKGVTRGMNGAEDNWIRMSRKLVKRLEAYTRRWGKPTIISGGRSVAYNRAVGGATLSQHIFSWFRIAYAVDIVPMIHHTTVRKSGLFGGIGYNRSTGKVAHVDVRVIPATWSYAR